MSGESGHAGGGVGVGGASAEAGQVAEAVEAGGAGEAVGKGGHHVGLRVRVGEHAGSGHV